MEALEYAMNRMGITFFIWAFYAVAFVWVLYGFGRMMFSNFKVGLGGIMAIISLPMIVIVHRSTDSLALGFIVGVCLFVGGFVLCAHGSGDEKDGEK